jgi:hypothetical protein
MNLAQPHDSLFRRCFSEPRNGGGIPAHPGSSKSLSEAIAFGLSLQPLPGTFIDPELRRSETDLLFSVSLIGEASGSTFICSSNTRAHTIRIFPCDFSATCAGHLGSSSASGIRGSPSFRRFYQSFWRRMPGPGRDLFNSKSSCVFLPVSQGQRESLLRPFLPLFQYRLYQLAEHDYRSLPGTPQGQLSLRSSKLSG